MADDTLPSDLVNFLDSPAGGGGTTSDWWRQASSPDSNYTLSDLVNAASGESSDPITTKAAEYLLGPDADIKGFVDWLSTQNLSQPASTWTAKDLDKYFSSASGEKPAVSAGPLSALGGVTGPTGGSTEDKSLWERFKSFVGEKTPEEQAAYKAEQLKSMGIDVNKLNEFQKMMAMNMVKPETPTWKSMLQLGLPVAGALSAYYGATKANDARKAYYDKLAKNEAEYNRFAAQQVPGMYAKITPATTGFSPLSAIRSRS